MVIYSPDESIPYGRFIKDLDMSIGHFILYGIWGFLCGRAFTNTILTTGSLKIPAGILIIAVIAVVEESFQAFFPTKTFSFFDMGWGILGIIVAVICIISGM